MMQAISMTQFVEWSCRACGAYVPANVAHGKPECDNPQPFLLEPSITSTHDQLISALQAEIARWKKAVEGLTPSGSEFVNDPEACAAHIRDRYNPLHTFKELRAEIARLTAQLRDEARVQSEMAKSLGKERSHSEVLKRENGTLRRLLRSVRPYMPKGIDNNEANAVDWRRYRELREALDSAIKEQG